MNLVKSFEYFNPLNCKGRCHIIGCGSVGSTVAENLARLGITKFTLYDFDVVEAHNITNQMFVNSDIGKEKVDAVADIITAINPDASKDIKICRKGYVNQTLNGYVFLCVDNIDTRRDIVEKSKGNRSIKAMFDFRTRLEDSQHYAADWSNSKDIENLLAQMQFTHEEAHEATPVSACNVELCVAPTVRMLCSTGVANFMNFVNGRPLYKTVFIDSFGLWIDAYK